MVRLIVPYTSGNTDTTARIFGQKLAERLGQQIVIDNRPGAGANIGAEIAARAAPDGYVLFYLSLSHAINASLYHKLNYDLVKDFAPIALLISSPYILTVHPSVPARSVKELIALAKARPGELNYASSGSTSHLAFEYLSTLARVKMNHIPYKSGAPATVAIISGQVEVALASASASMPHIKAGRLRGLRNFQCAALAAGRQAYRRSAESACPATTSAPGTASRRPPARRKSSLRV